MLLVLKISVTCQGHRLYVKNYGKLERDELMSFTISIFSANEMLKDPFMVFKAEYTSPFKIYMITNGVAVIVVGDGSLNISVPYVGLKSL